eukprot:SAG11_NODE_6977_length_1215_cov_4.177419_3_plen_126_part_01
MQHRIGLAYELDAPGVRFRDGSVITFKHAFDYEKNANLDPYSAKPRDAVEVWEGQDPPNPSPELSQTGTHQVEPRGKLKLLEHTSGPSSNKSTTKPSNAPTWRPALTTITEGVAEEWAERASRLTE